MSQNKQKLYVDRRRRILECEAGKHGTLSITPIIGIGRMIKIRKLTLKFIRRYQITGSICPAAYEISLSQHRTNLLNSFHVPPLRKYVASSMHVLGKEDV